MVTETDILNRLSDLEGIRTFGVSKGVAICLSMLRSERCYELLDGIVTPDLGVGERKAILFAVVLFFCPCKFSGYKIDRGLMRELRKRTNLSASLISHNIEDGGQRFRLIPSFARKATDTYNLLQTKKQNYGTY